MKTKIIYFLTVILGLCGCENNLYYVPDNFPKETFFSYLPYEQGQEVSFFNQTDTITLTVCNTYKIYSRGKRNCDCGVEMVHTSTMLSNDTIDLTISCMCSGRQDFSVQIEDWWAYHNVIGGGIIVLSEYKHHQKKLSDDIFNLFTEEIVLFGGAKVKQNIGLVCFTDKYGTQWTLIE